MQSTMRNSYLISNGVDLEKNYNNSHKRVGRAVILNQVHFENFSKRKGSNKDANDLKKVLGHIGFDVTIHSDMRTKEIFQILKEVAKEDHSESDCLVIVMLTHGGPNGRLYTSDGVMLVDDLWANFTGDKCASLIGKPKFFFIQACRGTKVDNGVMLMRDANHEGLLHQSSSSDYSIVIPTMADFLFMYSTYEGYYSFRSEKYGSWFIQALCKELSEALDEEINTILTGVNRSIAFSMQSRSLLLPNLDAAKQMPVIKSMLTKSFRFVRKTT